MHVHIWPSRTREVDAANAAISDQASWVASSVGHGNGVKVVVDPDRLERRIVGGLGEGRIAAQCSAGYAGQVEPPALRDEQSESHDRILLSLAVSIAAAAAGPQPGRSADDHIEPRMEDDLVYPAPGDEQDPGVLDVQELIDGVLPPSHAL